MTEPSNMSKAERVAWEMFRWQAVPMLGNVLWTWHLQCERKPQNGWDGDEAEAAVTMLRIWLEVFEFYTKRVREEFPHIRDYQEVERIIGESRGPYTAE